MPSNSTDWKQNDRKAGDLAGWTTESRRVYFELADKLLPQGWNIVDKSDSSHRWEDYVYCESEPGSRFSWVAFFQRAEMKLLALWQFGSNVRGGTEVSIIGK